MDESDSLSTLNARIAEVIDLRHAASLIEWDEQVYMPPAGAERHGSMLATIRRVAHEKFTSDEIGELLEREAGKGGRAAADSTERLLRVVRREYDKARRVPADFVAEQARVTSAAQHAWIAARAASDFPAFAPHLERVTELKRRLVSFFTPFDHPYDVLLDDFEPGMKTADVEHVFAVLRPRQVELIRAVGGRPEIDDSVLRQHFSETEMWQFATEVVTALGFDWRRGRQDKSVHPFASAIGPNDVRITTRYVADAPLSLLFSAIHETGHALYEQGIDAALATTLLGDAASLGIHESQSRLWENLVGRSRPFWEYFYPELQRRCPTQLAGVPLDDFYRAINKVSPSLIRTESDEATYNLHIMLRVEIEIALLENRIAVRDLPEYWRGRMQEYLGLEPPDDARGVLQDIHWSIGAFGYFATYTIGNLIAAQLWARYRASAPDSDENVRRGRFAPLLGWLREHVHRHGRALEPQELVEHATGARLQPEPYLRYLEDKYAEIYHL